jgi:hypothetical protein
VITRSEYRRRPWTFIYLIVSLGLIASSSEAQNRQFREPGKGLVPVPLFGLRVGTPLILSAYAGPVFGIHDAPTWGIGTGLVGEIGAGGGQASVAVLYVGGLYGGMPGMLRLQATVLRTWLVPWNAAKNATYVGPELQYTFNMPVGIRVGGLFRTDDGVRKKRILTLSLSVGM